MQIIQKNDPEGPRKAAEVLVSGGVIIYPTETLYGIGALATNERAVNRVFDIKGRASGKPIPVLVKNIEMLIEFAEVTPLGLKLTREFLPGPLTLVLRQKRKLPDIISGGTGKVGFRISSHPFVKSLFEFLDEPITSTSANLSGEENLLSFHEIYGEFRDLVDLIVDGGRLFPSKGSTVVDLTTTPPTMVREGEIEPRVLERHYEGW